MSTGPRLAAAFLCLALFLAGCRGEQPSNATRSSTGREAARKSGKVYRGQELPRPEFATVPCKVYTPDPGFLVLVDGVEARTESGELLLTPCEVGLPAGAHALILVKEKHEDLVRDVVVSSPDAFELRPAFRPFDTPAGYLSSRFATAEVGEPIPLLNLNTEGPVSDPFLADGGKSLYFVGERKEGRAVYQASRESAFAEFGEPTLIRATRGADRPCSPSLTLDGTLLVYLAFDNARAFSVRKEGDDFDGKKELKSGSENDLWQSAQISADGLTLYSRQERNGKRGTYSTTRAQIDARFNGKWTPKDFPGGHPVMTSDGLRQFAFDGQTLLRSSRVVMGADWSPPKAVAQLKLSGFQRRDEFRQIHVSDDEQWMVYCDDPRQGNLYAVRLSDGPRWGFVPRGHSIPQKEPTTVAGDEPEIEPESPTTESPVIPEVDPRTRPLPYVTFRQTLELLVRKWRFAEAGNLIDEALVAPRHEKDRDVIGWDRDAVQAAREFTEEVAKAAGQLKPGVEIRIGPARAEFTRFENGIVHGDLSGKPVSKPLHELSPTELTVLAEKTGDKGSDAFQLRVAAFHSFQPRPSLATINSRAARAGQPGRAFQDRMVRRKLHIATQEIERENTAEGLKMIDEIVGSNPRSEAAREALGLREKLPSRMAWEPIGGRAWDTTTPGEYVGGEPNGPVESAYLLSPREYKDFHLSLEWRTVGGPPAQGGVFFRYTRGQEIRKTAYKIHFANDAAGPLDRYSTGSLFGKEPPKVKVVKPEGQWNTLVLHVEGDRVQATINNALVLDARLADPMIAKQGHVALDGEFIGITYRKILLYELTPTK